MKILLLGDYFPSLSYQAAYNKKLVESIHKYSKGNYKTYLFSTAWCGNNYILGSANELAVVYPFTKRYYLDPIQIRLADNSYFAAVVGLCSSIIETHEIDILIVTDLREYGFAAEVLKIRFGVKTYLSDFSTDWHTFLNDSYISLNHEFLLSIFDKIFIEPYMEHQAMLTLGKEKLHCVLPYELDNERCQHIKFDKRTLFVVAFTNNKTNTFHLTDSILRQLNDYKKIIFSFGSHREIVNNLLRKSNYSNIEILNTVNSLKELYNISKKCELIIDVGVLQGDIVNTSIFSMYSYGYTPIKNSSKEENYYMNDSVEICTGYYAVNNITTTNIPTMASFI